MADEDLKAFKAVSIFAIICTSIVCLIIVAVLAGLGYVFILGIIWAAQHMQMLLA